MKSLIFSLLPVLYLAQIQYAAKEFGICPLIQCNGQPVLPVGLRDEIGVETAKVFCPKCKNVYQPPSSRSSSRGGGGHHSSFISGGNGGGGGGAVDGAAFGTTFPHLFLMTFNNLVPDPHPPDSAYVPRVFGFRVHRSAHRGSGGGGTVGAYSGNGRRVGGASSYAQRSMANMTSTKVTGAGSRVGTGMPMQEISNGVKDDENEGEDEKGVEDAGIGAAEEVVTTSLKPLKKEDSGDDNGQAAAAEEGGDCAIDETATKDDDNRKREKGENSDISSNASKRQRCSVEAGS